MKTNRVIKQLERLIDEINRAMRKNLPQKLGQKHRIVGKVRGIAIIVEKLGVNGNLFRVEGQTSARKPIVVLADPRAISFSLRYSKR